MASGGNATFDVRHCSHITKLEHTIANISFEAPRRGDVQLRLISPSGTPSMLLSTRPNDHTDKGLERWAFMTVHNWGEDPTGEWILEVSNMMPTEQVLEGFMDKEDIVEDEVVPRLMKTVRLTEWGFSLYGTGDEETEDEEEELEDDNPAINPEQAGNADKETVIGIWNDEQADDEEIHVDPEDLSPDADIPPNFIHNFEDGEIDTGAFDGHLPDEEANAVPQKYRRLILMYMILLEEYLIEDENGKRHGDLANVDLTEAFKRVKHMLQVQLLEAKRNDEDHEDMDLVAAYLQKKASQDGFKREQIEDLLETYRRSQDQERREQEEEREVLQEREEKAHLQEYEDKRVEEILELYKRVNKLQ